MTKAEFELIEDDTERGKLSGIPACCIAWFIKTWQPTLQISRNSNLPMEVRRAAIKFQDRYNKSPVVEKMGACYILCPTCRRTGFKAELIIHKD